MKTLRGGLALAATLLLVVACGGANQPATSAMPAGNDAPAASAAVDQVPAGDDAPAGATALTITGANKTVSTSGACHISTLSGAEDYGVSFETDDDDFWLLSFDVRKFAGPGTYEVVDSTIVGKGLVSITDMVGGSADSTGGTLTIGDGGTTGTVEADLEGDLGTMHVSGSFDCEML